jgi:hypothetical protein
MSGVDKDILKHRPPKHRRRTDWAKNKLAFVALLAVDIPNIRSQKQSQMIDALSIEFLPPKVGCTSQAPSLRVLAQRRYGSLYEIVLESHIHVQRYYDIPSRFSNSDIHARCESNVSAKLNDLDGGKSRPYKIG